MNKRQRKKKFKKEFNFKPLKFKPRFRKGIVGDKLLGPGIVILGSGMGKSTHINNLVKELEKDMNVVVIDTVKGAWDNFLKRETTPDKIKLKYERNISSLHTQG